MTFESYWKVPRDWSELARQDSLSLQHLEKGPSDGRFTCYLYHPRTGPKTTDPDDVFRIHCRILYYKPNEINYLPSLFKQFIFKQKGSTKQTTADKVGQQTSAKLGCNLISSISISAPSSRTFADRHQYLAEWPTPTRTDALGNSASSSATQLASKLNLEAHNN